MVLDQVLGREKKTFLFSSAKKSFFELTQRLASRDTIGMRHSSVETTITIDGREVLRRLFEEHVNLRDEGDVGHCIIGADGIVRTHKRIHDRKFITVFGEITVKRLGYGARGCNSLFPKDAILNLPIESYSHGIRRLVAQETAKSPFNEVINLVKQMTGVTLPKKTVEMLASRAAVDFDAFYTKQTNSSEQSQSLPLLILTTDGKGIVMRQEDLKEATRKRAKKSQHKLQKRKSKGEKANAKRMATVAAVYLIDKFSRTPEQIMGELKATESSVVRPRPVEKRVWASIEKDSKTVTTDLFEEALRRDPKQEKKWVCLIDGDPRQLKRVQAIAKKTGVDITIIMDVIHVIEYLWKAARVFYEESSPEAEKWVSERLLAILQGKVWQVASGIRRSATLRKIPKANRQPIEKCCGYLLKNRPYLQYHQYLRQGLPIATGIIEGACRHLIKDRMDVTGARWSLKGAEAIVKLRSLRSSGDFEKYWQFHEDQEYIRNHHSLYADPTVLDKCRKTIESNSQPLYE